MFKVNMLVQHYEETKLQEGSISFLNFLVMHYITDDGNDQDNDTDSKLPFKSKQIYSMIGFVSAPTQSVSIVISALGLIKYDYYVKVVSLIFTSYYALVWHPPQFS